MRSRLGKLLTLLKHYKYYLAAVLLCLISSSAIVFLQPLLISRLTDQGLLEMNFSVTVVPINTVNINKDKADEDKRD